MNFVDVGSRRGDFDASKLLERLSRDPDPLLRLSALSILGERGNPQAARDALIFGVPSADLLPVLGAMGPLIGRILQESLRERIGRDIVYGTEYNDAGESWELAERLGNLLERRAVERHLEPR